VTASAFAQDGALLISGGGKPGPEIVNRFAELAGGFDAPVVVIPTAGTREQYDRSWLESTFLREAGFRNLILLHTRDRRVADSEAFVEPLRRARAVWIFGGRQWRLADVYLHTRTQRELFDLLARGGVIGGGSAGATIMGSYLVRGAPEGNHIMMAKGHEEGFGFLSGVAIDQHLLARKRENDMLEVIAAHPRLLGIGIDEKTAALVQRGELIVIGASKVAIYESGKAPLFLNPGDRFGLGKRLSVR